MLKILVSLFLSGVVLATELTFPEVLRPDSEDQIGGVCHLHAAVALAEAVCFQELGVRLNISESYLAYRHLRPQLDGMKRYPLSEQGEATGYVSTLDAGFVVNSLPRILAGQAVMEEEFPRGPDFMSWTYYFVREERKRFIEAGEKSAKVAKALTPFGRNTKAVTERRLQRKANEFDKDFPEKLNEFMDKKFLERVPHAKESAQGGFYLTSQNKDYRACVALGLKYRQVDFTDELAIKLLTQKRPLICSGTWLFGEKWHPHAGVIVGYRQSEKGIEYYARHHESERPFAWNQPKCERLIYLDVP